MSLVYLGTSGFSYRDWVGPVYPSGTPPDQFLALYARRFPFLELNATYYRPPEAVGMTRFARRATEAGLRQVVVKAPATLTHDRPDSGDLLAQGVASFHEGIAPLAGAGILAGILVQFPYSFHYTRENRFYLSALAEQLVLRPPDTPVFVEFRIDEWQSPAVAEGLAMRGLVPVHVDLPELPRLPRSFLRWSSIPGGTDPGDSPAPRQGPRVRYLRLHGRNERQWWTGDNAERYDYRYREEEIAAAADTIATTIADSAVEVMYVAFNNHYRGKAVENATMLAAALTDRDVSVATAG